MGLPDALIIDREVDEVMFIERLGIDFDVDDELVAVVETAAVEVLV